MIVLVIKISALIFTWLIRIRIRIWNPHLECGFRMRIQETKIMRIHADPQYFVSVRCAGKLTAAAAWEKI